MYIVLVLLYSIKEDKAAKEQRGKRNIPQSLNDSEITHSVAHIMIYR